MDAFTLTLTGELGPRLAAELPIESELGRDRWWGQREERLCLGGRCWRKTMPIQESKSWGRAYESWEFKGDSAASMASWVRELLSKAEPESYRGTRVDVAFDFECQEDASPRDLVIALGAKPGVDRELELNGRKVTVSHGEEWGTRYVGSKPRRVRIYRKDREDAGIAAMFGPVMRVEPELFEEHAQAMWSVFMVQGDEACYASASAVLLEVLGVQLAPVGDLPELIKPDGLQVAGRVAELVRQYGRMLDVLRRHGVPLEAMAEAYASQGCGKAAGNRERRLRQEIEYAGGGERVGRLACQILGIDIDNRADSN